MRAMAGDPQAIAVLAQYQQIVSPPASQQPEGLQPQAGPAYSPEPLNLQMPSPGEQQPYPPQPPSAPPSAEQPQEALPQGAPRVADPMAGDSNDPERQARRQARKQKVELLKSRAAAGDTEAVAALQILEERRAQRRASRSSGSFVGFNGHLAFIRGLGEEEVALALEGGACERAALSRRFSRASGNNDLLGARLPNLPPRSNPYKMKTSQLHPHYVQAQRNSARRGNKEAQRVLKFHNLSW
jgi:hypothetical protein